MTTVIEWASKSQLYEFSSASFRIIEVHEIHFVRCLRHVCVWRLHFNDASTQRATGRANFGGIIIDRRRDGRGN